MLCRYVFVIGWATTGIYTYRHTLSLHDALPICDLDCQEVHQPWSAVPGSYPGRQYRPDESRGQVRISSRLQVLHLRYMVDTPGDYAFHCRPGSYDSYPGDRKSTRLNSSH